MNVLDRVQGCNRIIVQGHWKIEEQPEEGRGLGEQHWEREEQGIGRPRGPGQGWTVRKTDFEEPVISQCQEDAGYEKLNDSENKGFPTSRIF